MLCCWAIWACSSGSRSAYLGSARRLNDCCGSGNGLTICGAPDGAGAWYCCAGG